jgi:hypothetical protein
MALGKSHTFNGKTIDGSSIYRIPENLIVPYQFTSLPTGAQGQVQWSENPPIGWGEYGPYLGVFNKVYLRRDGSLETIPNGGGNVHSIKTFGVGSTLGQPSVGNVSIDQYDNFTLQNNWSIYQLDYNIFDIPINRNYVNFGCFYKVPANDRLRPLNFGFVRIDFQAGFVAPSYMNYYTIGGEDMPVLVGGTNSYYYINGYENSPPRIYNPLSQWNGSRIIKLKNLGRITQGSNTDDWQFLNFKVEIPTFSTTAPDGDDSTNGRATQVNFKFGFCENLSYLDVLPRVDSGSVIFYYPFLYYT